MALINRLKSCLIFIVQVLNCSSRVTGKTPLEADGALGCPTERIADPAATEDSANNSLAPAASEETPAASAEEEEEDANGPKAAANQEDPIFAV